MKLSDIASLIGYEPRILSLRGDAYLYSVMIKNFTGVAIPEEPEFMKLLFLTFESLTGVGIDAVGYHYVETLNRGGLSSGMVSPEVWKEEIFPFLYNAVYLWKELQPLKKITDYIFYDSWQLKSLEIQPNDQFIVLKDVGD